MLHAEEKRLVPNAPQTLSDCARTRRQIPSKIHQPHQAIRVRIHPGDQSSPGRTAERCRPKVIDQPNALRRQPVKRGCMKYRLAVTTEMSTQVMRNDVEDVGASCHLILSSGLPRI